MRPAAHPPGTTVEVRDLFYNVPARRKFVRSDATELSHIAALVERLALSRFDVSFRLRHGNRVLLETAAAAAGADELARLAQVLGRDFPAAAVPVRHAAGPVLLSGWAGLPTRSRAQPDQQFWFVNGRSVRDRLLMNAVRLAYRDVLYHGRHAAYVLYLTLDPKLVDVNAHPAKLEVRFRDSRQIHDFVFRAVERALADTKPDLAAPGALRPGAFGGGGPRAPWPSAAAAAQALALPAPLLPRAGRRARCVGDRGGRPGSPPPRPRHACRTRRAAPRHRAGAAARRLHPRPDRGGPGAGGHACRSRARAVREVQGRKRRGGALPPSTCSSRS